MIKYPKIQTVFLRDPETKHKTLLHGQFAKPEFEYLANAQWLFTEKIHGTNTRVGWNGKDVEYGGKTETAQIPAFLIKRLQEAFSPKIMSAQFGSEPTDVTLFGEGYGARIQKGGGRYISNGVDFILFDACIGGVWLTDDGVSKLAGEMGIRSVPRLRTGTLWEAIEYVEAGYKSLVAEDNTYDAEGLVLRPLVPLFDRKADRVIAKIKHGDFKR